MIVETVKIDDLVSPDYNPRHITPEALESLKQSIDEFGYIDPLIVNRVNMHVVGGNQRLECLKALDYTEVEVIFIEEPDLNREKAINIRLNNSSGDWDIGKLDNIFNDLEIEGFDLTLTGFATENLQPFESSKTTEIPTSETITSDIPIKNETTIERGINRTDPDYKESAHEIQEDDFEEKEDIKVHVAKGDLWKLGNHYLFCGDATNKDDLEILLTPESERAVIDLVFTDPPYDFTECNYHENIEKFTENAHIFIMNDDINMIRYLRKSNLTFKQFFIANFGFASPRGNDPYLQHILVSHEVNGDAKKHENLHDSFRSIVKMEYRGRLKDDITPHKHQKSIEFISKFLIHYATTNVLDLFGGSGSTLIACEQLNLNCYMMELDPYYCQVIINRWEHYTGQKAIKIN